MIKYTGYGNAAGMFAQKGLLGGNRPTDGAEFSSDSEDSETEEYAQNKDNINPVVGCYEAPHPNPLAGMTDEQVKLPLTDTHTLKKKKIFNLLGLKFLLLSLIRSNCKPSMNLIFRKNMKQ